MTATPKSPVQSAHKGSTTLKSSKPPTQQFEPRRTVECSSQGIHRRWEIGPENVQTRVLEDNDGR